MKIKTTDRIIGVTVIGLGRIGKVHLKNVLANPRLEPRWLVDLEQGYLETVRDEFHIPREQCSVTTFDDIAPALTDERVGLILILTPTDTHPSMIELCVNKGNGQPIFCEKPISVHTDEVLKCYRLAEEAGVQLMCGFNRRFDPTYRRLEDLVRKEAGQIQTIHATLAANPSPTRQFLKQCHSSRNGVIFYDTGTHFVDLVLWLLNGEIPTEVHSIGHSFTEMFKDYNEPDVTMTTLKFASGVSVVVELGYVSSVKFDMRLEVRGTGGVIQADNPAATGVTRITPEGRVRDGLAEKLWDRFGESYYNELEYMADIAQGKKTVDITGEHCAKVADVVDAMRKSYYEKKIVFLQDESNGDKGEQ